MLATAASNVKLTNSSFRQNTAIAGEPLELKLIPSIAVFSAQSLGNNCR